MLLRRTGSVTHRTVRPAPVWGMGLRKLKFGEREH